MLSLRHFYALDGEHESHSDDEDGARFEYILIISLRQRIAEKAEHESPPF